MGKARAGGGGGEGRRGAQYCAAICPRMSSNKMKTQIMVGHATRHDPPYTILSCIPEAGRRRI